jgi:hypothetical protein
MIKRRMLLQLLGGAAAWAGFPAPPFAQPVALGTTDEIRLRALAEVVLPRELSDAARAQVVDGFLRWIRNYREGAEMDHGYGFTRLRRTPTSPAARYPAQLAALDRAAQAKGSSFESIDAGGRRAVVSASIDAAKIERLPVHPTGEHIATDLMGFYFHGEAANDLAYRAAIRRDSCRGLPGSESTPSRLGTNSEPGQSRVRDGSESGQSRVRVR